VIGSAISVPFYVGDFLICVQLSQSVFPTVFTWLEDQYMRSYLMAMVVSTRGSTMDKHH